jgi:protoheme IX farnesyltransferase
MIRTYYLLTKPGIIMGNLVTTIGGFALASRGRFDLPLFLFLLAGLGGVIASACVFNNYIDRELDRKMERTKHRPLAAGLVSGKRAILFALALGLGGISLLLFKTNLLSASLSALGFFVYVALYSFWKSRTTYATLVGSVSGALPPVIGYTAASNNIDVGALILFLLLVLWQMPHFFSIAMYRFNDYAAAAIPVLPIKKGITAAKVHMLLYIAAFLLACTTLLLFGYAGTAYLLVSSIAGFVWLILCAQGFTAQDDKLWARQMFVCSLVVIMALCLMISLDSASPATQIGALSR